MKNIHVLSTDKPSRLLINREDTLVLTSNYYSSSNPQNIYITSDEEIKEGDWVLFISTNEVIKVPLGGFKGKVCKKIIITTDKDLIKDGVQAIDDEFLEWFVENPSCERVDIETMIECEKCGKEHCDNLNCRGYKDIPYYKIIIPKEEPKQETLEEVADKWVFEINGQKWSNNDDTAGDNYGSFIAGVKFQQDKQDEFAIGFAKWITNEKSEYAILYGNQEKRFATFEKDYTPKELLEIYKKEKGL